MTGEASSDDRLDQRHDQRFDWQLDRQLDRLIETRPVFTSATERIMAVLAHRPDIALDDLVVSSRTPVRTALLVLHHLDETGRLRPLGTAAEFGACGEAARRRLSPWAERYLTSVDHREEPGLLWGQRRLIPPSAMDRAAYVLSLAGALAPGPAIAFLGDDDMVSPLVAAASPDARVFVIDIDSGVIDRVRRVAADLGAELSARQADLSALSAVSAGGDLAEGPADIVVCDPFPSGDGSFETLFWREAVRVLRPGGVLVTTVAPSHKPERYARGALSRLEPLDLHLIELKADFGRYEVFDFELVSVERSFVDELGLVPTISHTKSMLAARYLGNAPSASPADEPAVDFARWSAAAGSHYLTAQAGLDRQLELVRLRGVEPPPEPPTPAAPHPPHGPHAPHAPHAGATLTNGSTWLELAWRAIESWERWRLDG